MSAISLRRLVVRDRGPKTVDQFSLDQRLGEIALDPQCQHALADAIIRIGGDEDCRDRAPDVDQMLVKLGSRHCGHVDIRDQACCGRECGGSQEIGCGREYCSGIVQRVEEPAHRVSKRFIVIDD